MADRPILFSAPMIRAILREIENPGTGKTQTRRVLKPQPPQFMHYGKDIMDWGLSGIYQDDNNEGTNRWWLDVQTDVDDNSHSEIKVAAAVGDRLYVREHWRVSRKWDRTAPRDLPARTMTVFLNAGGSIANQVSGRWEPDNCYPLVRPDWVGKHRQAMHMPRWASRITLIVEGVKVERLQDISEIDAIAEGMMMHPLDGDPEVAGAWTGGVDYLYGWDARGAFMRTWELINGIESWKANPWVVAYTFRPFLGNIDQVEG